MMKRMMRGVLGVLLGLSCAACAVTAEELTGEAAGYGGPLKVMVTTDQGKLASVQVTEHHETQGVGTRAIEALPEAMVSAGTWDVEAVSGATVTSNALKEAVRTALGDTAEQSGEGSPTNLATLPPATFLPEGAMAGLGMTATGRIGPGKDAQDNPVYSFNVVMAAALFDQAGRVQEMTIDQLEVITPNVSGEAGAVFSGFPGQGGFAKYDAAAGKIDGRTEDTDETFLQEVEKWQTKGMMGDDYKLDSGTWREQMAAYAKAFQGMTVEEIEAWYGKYCSDTTGRPLAKDGKDKADQEKYAALTEAEQEILADVTSSATISLQGEYGDVLGAIRRAWEDAQQRRP